VALHLAGIWPKQAAQKKAEREARGSDEESAEEGAGRRRASRATSDIMPDLGENTNRLAVDFEMATGLDEALGLLSTAGGGWVGQRGGKGVEGGRGPHARLFVCVYACPCVSVCVCVCASLNVCVFVWQGVQGRRSTRRRG
jgi:hypothetical protein